MLQVSRMGSTGVLYCACFIVSVGRSLPWEIQVAVRPGKASRGSRTTPTASTSRTFVALCTERCLGNVFPMSGGPQRARSAGNLRRGLSSSVSQRTRCSSHPMEMKGTGEKVAAQRGIETCKAQAQEVRCLHRLTAARVKGSFHIHSVPSTLNRCCVR